MVRGTARSLAVIKLCLFLLSTASPVSPKSFLTGFIANAGANEVYGRPVGVAVLQNGSLLVADDASNTLWLVRCQAIERNDLQCNFQS